MQTRRRCDGLTGFMGLGVRVSGGGEGVFEAVVVVAVVMVFRRCWREEMRARRVWNWIRLIIFGASFHTIVCYKTTCVVVKFKKLIKILFFSSS